MNIICFHNPDEENGYLSNWYLSQFSINGIQFSSMEQYMMYSKAVCFNDKVIAEQILNTQDVAHIKELGRSVLDYNAKFKQNEDLKRKLLGTGNNVLAECAVRDQIWGIGLSMKNPDRFEPENWNGQNLLGYALMMVRESL